MIKVKDNYSRAAVYEINKPGCGAITVRISTSVMAVYLQGCEPNRGPVEQAKLLGTYGFDVDGSGMVIGFVRVGD